jgi:hypothetical protein
MWDTNLIRIKSSLCKKIRGGVSKSLAEQFEAPARVHNNFIIMDQQRLLSHAKRRLQHYMGYTRKYKYL